MVLYNRKLNTKIKIFSQLYVGLRDQGVDKPKLGFATPFEKGSAFKKRKTTVDKWAKVTRYDYDEKKQHLPSTLKPAIVENTLREGFKITDDVKRVYWGGGSVVWRVLDPNGYELEIPSANLMAIIQVSGLGEGGLIPGKCCWGRDGATNILLHEKSDAYMYAIKNAKDTKKAKKLHVKSPEAGAKYVLQSGDTATYLGKFYVYSLKIVMHKPEGSYRDREYSYHEVSVTTPSGHSYIGKMFTHEILDEGQFDAVQLSTEQVHFYKKAPLISRADGDVLTDKQIQKIIDARDYVFAASDKYNPIIHVSREKPRDLVFKQIPMSEKTFKDVLLKAEQIAKNDYLGFNQLFYNCKRLLPMGFTMGADEGVLWQHGCTYNANYPGKTEEFFCPTQWDEKQIKRVDCYYGRTHIIGPYLQGVTFKTEPVPVKATVVEWLEELFANGYLKEIIVEEKVS